MNNTITPELQKQIEQEAKSSAANFCYHPGSSENEDNESAYTTGASRYAALWQAAEARADRYEKALREIQSKVRKTIFPAKACTEIDRHITELLTPKTSSDE